jgi:hypothetical protein
MLSVRYSESPHPCPTVLLSNIFALFNILSSSRSIFVLRSKNVLSARRNILQSFYLIPNLLSFCLIFYSPLRFILGGPVQYSVIFLFKILPSVGSLFSIPDTVFYILLLPYFQKILVPVRSPICSVFCRKSKLTNCYVSRFSTKYIFNAEREKD